MSLRAVSLRASSGAVAPAWRWSIEIEIARDADGASARDRRRRGPAHPRGPLERERQGRLGPEALADLEASLRALGALEATFARAAVAPKERRAGGAPGTLRLETDDRVVVRELTARELDEDDGDEALRACVAAIEACADRIVGAG